MKSGAGGPCNHCNRTSSPCWRKGPPEKPNLCNACGARYLVKKSLDNYLPQDALMATAAAHREFQLAGLAPAIVPLPRPSTKACSDPSLKRKGQNASRYSVDDLYVREPGYEHSKLSKVIMQASSPGQDVAPLPLQAQLGIPAWLSNQHVDSCDSSATSFSKEQGDDKSTLDSVKRMRVVPRVAAGKAEGADNSPMYTYSRLRHFQDDCLDADASVRVVVKREASPMFQRRPRKQAKPCACPVA